MRSFAILQQRPRSAVRTHLDCNMNVTALDVLMWRKPSVSQEAIKFPQRASPVSRALLAGLLEKNPRKRCVISYLETV